MTRETWMLNHLMHDIRQQFKNSDELKRKLNYYNRGFMSLGELLQESGAEIARLDRIAMEAEWNRENGIEEGE